VGVGFYLKATSMTDVTRILSAIEQGDPSAAEQLLPLVYDELRKLAPKRWLRSSRPDFAGHGPGPRGVHPAGGRGESLALDSRRHFFSARPRRCVGFWWKMPAANAVSNAAERSFE